MQPHAIVGKAALARIPGARKAVRAGENRPWAAGDACQHGVDFGHRPLALTACQERERVHDVAAALLARDTGGKLRRAQRVGGRFECLRHLIVHETHPSEVLIIERDTIGPGVIEHLVH